MHGCGHNLQKLILTLTLTVSVSLSLYIYIYLCVSGISVACCVRISCV